MYRRYLLIERWNPDEVDNWGDAYWEDHKGDCHRGGDQPAAIYRNGDMEWYKNGHLHRERDRPSVIDFYGHMWWHKNGKQHRENDKPAIVIDANQMWWFENGSEYLPSIGIINYWVGYYQEYFADLNKEAQDV